MTAKRPVHPVAAVFPMLGDDELRDLAADIKANGLLHPIVLDRKGRVVDGRNRLAACKLADVEPSFITLDIVDVIGFVISQNVNRRHMGAGARAMAITKAVRDQEEKCGHRTFRQGELRAMVGVGERAMKEASIVYQYAPELVSRVIAGESLEGAYIVAAENKKIEAADKRRMSRLKRDYPDLAERVGETTLTLDDAIAIADTLDRKRRLVEQIETLETEIQLTTERIEASLGITLTQSEALAAEHFGSGEELIESASPFGSAPTAGDVMPEVIAAIDIDELEAHERRVDALRLRERLLGLVGGRDPRELIEGLTITEARDLTRTLSLILRWVAAAYTASETLAASGKVEAIR